MRCLHTPLLCLFCAAASLAAEAQVPPTCEFGFFKGRQLQYGWKYRSSAFERWTSQPATWDPYGPAPTGLSAAFSITVVGSGPMGAGEVRMTEVVLEEPPGSTWQDAFRP